MALSWDVDDVTAAPSGNEQDWKAWCEQVSYDQPDLPEEQRYTNWQLLEALIWRSMPLGWGWQLTEAKVQTAIKRNAIYERVHGGRHGAGVLIPPAFIADMVGIRTNVSPITDAAFFGNVRRWLNEHATNVYRRHTEAVAKKQADAEHDEKVRAAFEKVRTRDAELLERLADS